MGDVLQDYSTFTTAAHSSRDWAEKNTVECQFKRPIFFPLEYLIIKYTVIVVTFTDSEEFNTASRFGNK